MDRLDAALNAQAAAFYDDTSTWVDRRGYTLSDRIWSQRADMRERIDRTIRQGILDGATVDDVANDLLSFIRPTYARFGGGKARHAATRLAGHEMRRAHSLATRDVSLIDPAAGFLRYRTAAGHSAPDECGEIASRDVGYGRGVYPAKDCPLPPRHPQCACDVEIVRWEDLGGPAAQGMSAFVEQLRVKYDLADPPDLSPDELAIFRRETAAIRQAVQFMFNAWFEQTGLVSREQLMDTSPTVAAWVDRVRAEKVRRRGS